MGREKEAALERDEARYAAAERDDRRCAYCGNIIPYGDDPGPHGECSACVGTLKPD